MQSEFKYAVALLASLLLTGSLLAVSTGPAQAAEPAVKVIQHNLDGGPITEVVRNANAQGANIMTLQELCSTELDKLQAAGWKSSGSWVSTKPGSCADGSDEGQAIVFRAPVTAEAFAYQTSLSNPGDPDGLGPARGATNRTGFALTCFTNLKGILAGTTKLRVCTTHLFTNGGPEIDGDAVRGQQMAEIQAVLDDWTAGGSKVIFTGDLNMTPLSSQLNWIYSEFGEAGGGKTGVSPTTDNNTKLDYVFGDRTPGLAAKSLTLNPVGYSTHHVVKASITFP